jgi:CRISPR system Cascade subunit CasC
MVRNLYLDFHILQSVPPSNLNRDDNGTPKHAQYGGVRRARVSSQAWKRATRTTFAQSGTIAPEKLGVRTKQISRQLATAIRERTGLQEADAVKLATALLSAFGIKAGKKDGDTAYLLFFGRGQLDEIVSLIADRAHDLATLDAKALNGEVEALPVTAQLKTGHPIDVALFGRMVADLPGLNVDAAVQVAHALSTHPVEIEFDYYTAVDDNPSTETGAGMIGTVEFNSATLYRYATLGVHLLRENLDNDETTVAATAAFADAFIRSIPTGHGNTFAHRTLPHLAAVVFRSDQPVNLVSAFERPVYGGVDGIAGESAQRLAAEHAAVAETWSLAEAPLVATYTYGDPTAAKLADVYGHSVPLKELISTVRARTAEYLAQEDAK